MAPLFRRSPAFFMASDGRLVFGDSASATAGIADLGRSIKQIELQWGPDMKVDPLAKDLAAMGAPYHEIRTDSFGEHVDESGYFTGVVEYHGGHWQFRNTHWSSAGHPAAH